MWNSIGSMGYLACQWLITLVVVRLSADFDNPGVLALAMSVCNVFHCVSLYNMRSFQVSDLNGKYADGDYVMTRILLGLGALLVACAYGFISSYTVLQRTCIVIYMCFKLTEAYCDVIHGAVQKKERMDIEGKSLLLRGISTVSAFAIVLKTTNSLPLAICSMAVAGFLVLLLFDVPKGKRIANIVPVFHADKIVAILKECFGLFISSLIFNAMLSLPKIYLEQAHGSAILGIYSTVAAPTLLVQTLATYVFNPLLTRFTSRLMMGETKEFQSLLLRCGAAIIGIMALALIVAKFLGVWGLTFLYGQELAQYQGLLYPLVINSGLTALVWFLNMILIVLRKSKALVMACTIGLAACLVFCIMLIQPLAMQGACWAAIGGQSIQVIILVAVMIRCLKKMKAPVTEA